MDSTAIASLVQQVLGIAVGGVALQHTLEHAIMDKISSPGLKVGVTLLGGLAASTITSMAGGMPWQAALAGSFQNGIVLAGAAMAANQTPLAAVSAKL